MKISENETADERAQKKKEQMQENGERPPRAVCDLLVGWLSFFPPSALLQIPPASRTFTDLPI
jgi:hypothetical protein